MCKKLEFQSCFTALCLFSAIVAVSGQAAADPADVSPLKIEDVSGLFGAAIYVPGPMREDADQPFLVLEKTAIALGEKSIRKAIGIHDTQSGLGLGALVLGLGAFATTLFDSPRDLGKGLGLGAAGIQLGGQVMGYDARRSAMILGSKAYECEASAIAPLKGYGKQSDWIAAQRQLTVASSADIRSAVETVVAAPAEIHSSLYTIAAGIDAKIQYGSAPNAQAIASAFQTYSTQGGKAVEAPAETQALVSKAHAIAEGDRAHIAPPPASSTPELDKIAMLLNSGELRSAIVGLKSHLAACEALVQ